MNQSGARNLFIKDLEPNQKSVNLNVIVLDVTKPNTTKDGHEVRTVRIADKTGSINLSVWNEHGSVLREGDILRLNGCFTQIWKNSLQVKISNKGQVIKIGEFMMVFNESPDMSVLSPEVIKSIMEQGKQQTNANGSYSNNKNNIIS
jgi:ssDNA-binding replication factor A large subunit